MTQVAGRQVRDNESSLGDQGVHGTVQMATYPRPEGIEPVLPVRNLRLRRKTMFDKE